MALEPDGLTLERVQLVHDLIGAWNAHDFDRFMEFLTDDVEWDDPAMSAPARGKEAVRTFAQAVLTAVPRFFADSAAQSASRRTGSCAVPWRITGTHCIRWRRATPLLSGRRRSTASTTWNSRVTGSSASGRISTRTAAGQLLGVSLRPRPGSWVERALVAAQRLIAAFVRPVDVHRSPMRPMTGNEPRAPRPEPRASITNHEHEPSTINHQLILLGRCEDRLHSLWRTPVKPWYEELFENYAESYDREAFTQGTVAECDFIETEFGPDRTGRCWTSVAAPAATPSSWPGAAGR